MFDISMGRRSPRQSSVRFAERLRGRLHREQRAVSEDERFEIYTDLATLLAASEERTRGATKG